MAQQGRQEMFDYDLLVIGAGSGGATAAAGAVEMNVRNVLMIEKAQVGGACTNTGCVPTKAELYAAKLLRGARRSKALGFNESEPAADFHGFHDYKERIVQRIRRSGEESLKRIGLEVKKGAARLTGPHSVEVDGSTVTGKYLLIATGARPFKPPIEGLEEVPFLTSTTALEMRSLPQSIAIIGGSYIGLEFATLYKSLGVDVLVIEMADRLAKTEDREICDYLKSALLQRGIAVETGLRVKRARREAGQITLEAEKEGREVKYSADRIFLAVGREPNLAGLNLEAAGVKHGPRGIEVDKFLQTSEPSIYAIGDVIPTIQLEHVAVYEGWLAANNMFSGGKIEADYRFIPTVIFSDPEVAGVGLTEAEARAGNRGVQAVTLPYKSLPMAQISQETDGLIKLVADENGILLGVHIVGAEAGNLVHLGALAMQFALPVNHMAEAISAYPTLAQGFYYACQLLSEKLAASRAA